MSADTDERATTPKSPWRIALAYALVLLGPVLAWLAWVSWSADKASDEMHVLWFVTVATTCFFAGGLAPRGALHFAALVASTVISVMTVLYLWWSSVDQTGLFMIGIIMATPLVSMAAPLLLILGRYFAPVGPRTASTVSTSD